MDAIAAVLVNIRDLEPLGIAADQKRALLGCDNHIEGGVNARQLCEAESLHTDKGLDVRDDDGGFLLGLGSSLVVHQGPFDRDLVTDGELVTLGDRGTIDPETAINLNPILLAKRPVIGQVVSGVAVLGADLVDLTDDTLDTVSSASDITVAKRSYYLESLLDCHRDGLCFLGSLKEIDILGLATTLDSGDSVTGFFGRGGGESDGNLSGTTGSRANGNPFRKVRDRP